MVGYLPPVPANYVRHLQSKMKFTTFADAKQFAIKLAKDHGRSALVTRFSDGWIVHDEAEGANIQLVNPDHQVAVSTLDDSFFTPDPALKRAIESWQQQKEQHPTCYMCNGKGEGNGRMCHTCMGRGYING